MTSAVVCGIEIEEWRAVPGFPNHSVSTLGRVRVQRDGSPPRPLTANVATRSGVALVTLSHGRHDLTIQVHRLVARVFLGVRDRRQRVKFVDGDPLNAALGNLSLDPTTPAERLAGRARRIPRLRWLADLLPITPETLVARRRALGLSRARLATLLGVSPDQIGRWEAGSVEPSRPVAISLALEALEARRPAPTARGSSRHVVALTAAEAATEQWLAIPDHPDYAISDRGRVMRVTPGSGPSRNGNYLLATHRNRNGYVGCSLHTGGRPARLLVSRLVLRAFDGPPPDADPDWEADHRDGDPGNNRLTNLRWLRTADNRRRRDGHQVGADDAHLSEMASVERHADWEIFPIGHIGNSSPSAPPRH